MYKIGVIGTSWAARSPIPTFQTYKGVEINSICSGNIQNAINCSKEFEIPNVEKNYVDLCQREDVDIIYIGAPVDLHADMFITAAKANKHIICEKPLSLNKKDSDLMVQAANHNNIETIVAFTMRHFSSHQLIKKLISKGKIGDPIHISINDFRGIPQSKNLPKYNWWHQKNKGGGILGAMGSHFIDLTRFMIADFDKVFGSLESINNQASGHGNSIRKITSDDIFTLNGTLSSSTSVSINCSIATNTRLGSNRSIEIYGTKGTLSLLGDEISPGGAKLLFSSNKSNTKNEIAVPPLKMSQAAKNSAVPRFGLMIEKLIKSINGNRQDPNVVDGLMCQKVIDAVHLSNESGKVIKVR